MSYSGIGKRCNSADKNQREKKQFVMRLNYGDGIEAEMNKKRIVCHNKYPAHSLTLQYNITHGIVELDLAAHSIIFVFWAN